MLTVSKTELEAKLFEYLREVETSGDEVVVTDGGVPVARIVPVCNGLSVDEAFADLRGRLQWTRDLDGPTVDEWHDP
ncbi:MAG: type II toxin-antitoxin system prevent-host-death family antitoxin [Gemmatimonadaceae bacterium]|nr:type II toxin-antitoxin system prevent-host-death family antitoxin [Gemmatimonadaceae bacterium]